jgi:hypothetical protein
MNLNTDSLESQSDPKIAKLPFTFYDANTDQKTELNLSFKIFQDLANSFNIN